MQIEVGTVIYLIDSKEKAVVPVRINEQIVTRKLDGETTTHKIELPNGKTAVLERMDVMHFLSLDDVRSHLMARAEQVVEEGIKLASHTADEKFGNKQPAGVEANTSELADSDDLQITLPDGKVAKVNIRVPEEFVHENFGN